MKRTKDPGLEHVQSLGIKAYRNANAFLNTFDEKFGEQGTEALNKITETMRDDGMGEAYYNELYQHADAALYLEGSRTADVIRRECNWIDSHREYFGKTILEIGSGFGFMTSFLGKTFPESQILGIDRADTDIADEVVGKYGIRNTKLERCTLKSISDAGKTFDTVITFETPRENLEKRLDIPLKRIFEDWRSVSDEYFKNLIPYAEEVKKTLGERGVLVSVESDIDLLFFGWIRALGRSGIAVEADETIKADILGDPVEMPVTIGRAGTPLTDREAEDVWKKLLGYDSDAVYWTGWNAPIAESEKAKDLMKGYYIVDPGTGREIRRIAYFRMKDDDDKRLLTLWDQDTGWSAEVERSDGDEEIFDMIEEMAGLLKQQGMRAEPINSQKA